MRFLIVLMSMCFVFNTFAQNIDFIKKANLFDENRGYIEESGEEVDTEKEVKLPVNMPVLDGIIIIKDYKKAIFTYYDKEKKKKVSAYHSVGDKFANAILKELTSEYVVLLFDGKKYKLYPDTKLKAKKTSGRYTAPTRAGYTPPPPPKKASVKTSPSSPAPDRRSKKNIIDRVKTRVKRNSGSIRTVRRTKPVIKKKPSSRTFTGKGGSSNPFAGGQVTTSSSKTKNNRTKTPF